MAVLKDLTEITSPSTEALFYVSEGDKDYKMTYGNVVGLSGDVTLGELTLTDTLISEVADGTTPMEITSTTVVDNLNVDQVDGADLSTDGTFASNSDVLIPSEKAVKTYADGKVSLTGDETVAGVKTFSDDIYIKNLSAKNYIINGNFDIWQRGTSFTTTGEYTSDRWRPSFVGGTATISQQAFTVGQTDVPNEPRYFIRCAFTGAPTSSANLAQRVEDVRTLAGKTVTLSFYAKSSDITTASSVVFQNFGSGGSDGVLVLNENITLSATWQKFTHTFTFPSISDKTIGTGSYLDVRPIYIGKLTGTIDLAQVMLNEGSVALPFNYYGGGKIDDEEACYWFFERLGGNAYFYYANGIANSTSVGLFILNYKKKRITPTSITFSGVDDYEVSYQGTASIATSNITTFGISPQSCRLSTTTAPSLTAGDALLLRGKNSATHYIDIYAEL